jgi:hypothetical protein
MASFSLALVCLGQLSQSISRISYIAESARAMGGQIDALVSTTRSFSMQHSLATYYWPSNKEEV